MEPNAIVLAVVISVLVAGVVAAALGRGTIARRGGRLHGPRRALYRELLRRVRGDEACAARLIELERSEAPRASKPELVRRALQKLERDRGR